MSASTDHPHYYGDGSGRDSYIHLNNGGLRGRHSIDDFRNHLRSSQAPPLPASTAVHFPRLDVKRRQAAIRQRLVSSYLATPRNPLYFPANAPTLLPPQPHTSRSVSYSIRDKLHGRSGRTNKLSRTLPVEVETQRPFRANHPVAYTQYHPQQPAYHHPEYQAQGPTGYQAQGPTGYQAQGPAGYGFPAEPYAPYCGPHPGSHHPEPYPGPAGARSGYGGYEVPPPRNLPTMHFQPGPVPHPVLA